MAHYQELPPLVTGVSPAEIVVKDKVGSLQSYSTHRPGSDGFIFQSIVAEALTLSPAHQSTQTQTATLTGYSWMLSVYAAVISAKSIHKGTIKICSTRNAQTFSNPLPFFSFMCFLKRGKQQHCFTVAGEKLGFSGRHNLELTTQCLPLYETLFQVHSSAPTGA